MMSANYPEGFEVPLHRSIVDPIMIAGLPRILCYLLWTTASALVLGMRIVWVLPIAILLHMIFAKFAKDDPHFYAVFIRVLKSPHRLEP